MQYLIGLCFNLRNLNPTEEVKLDNDIISNNHTIDLSLTKLGIHTIQITVKDNAGNITELTQIFQTTTNHDTIKQNLSYYKDIGIITKKVKKHLKVYLKTAQKYHNQSKHKKGNKKEKEILCSNILARYVILLFTLSRV